VAPKSNQFQFYFSRLAGAILASLPFKCVVADSAMPNSPAPNHSSSIVIVSHQAQDDGYINLTSQPRAADGSPIACAADRSPVKAGEISKTSFEKRCSSDLTRRSSLEMVAAQAQAHITYALNLAERGAVHSAKSEFIVALNLIADAIDADTNNPNRAYARALKAGLTAIEESQDFAPADTTRQIEINLSQLASTHRTPVLKDVDTSTVTRAEALQRYHTFASQQLAFAGGNSNIASAALYGLGRAESISVAGGAHNPLGGQNAMALFQAALAIDPQNYMAANELGVLMARYGDLDGAENQLLHSLSIKPQVEAWHNLAIVYRSKGKPQEAERSEQEREKLAAAQRSSGEGMEKAADAGPRPVLRWVDPDSFAASGTPYGLDGPPISSTQSASINQSDSLGRRLISKLNPWSKAKSSPQPTDETRLSERTNASSAIGTNGQPLLK
jgi:tetratricopeptide (TPR) repeat protein